MEFDPKGIGPAEANGVANLHNNIHELSYGDSLIDDTYDEDSFRRQRRVTFNMVQIKDRIGESKVYRVNMKKYHKFMPTHVFTLYDKDKILFIAKYRKASSKTIFIKKGGDIHLSKPPFDYKITMKGKEKKKFKLLVGTSNETMARISIMDSPKVQRKVKLDFKKEEDSTGYPSRMTSRSPYNLDGYAGPETAGKFTIRSPKNCVLEGFLCRRPIILKTVAENDFELEIVWQLNPIYLFFLGIASFLA